MVKANHAIDLKSVEEHLDKWITDGEATKKGKLISINLGKMGYDKLLATGTPSKAYKISINATSVKAKQKIEAAGGEVING